MSTVDPTSPTGAPASVDNTNNTCFFSKACDWFKTKECAGKALVCLATAFLAANSLPLWLTGAALSVGVLSAYTLKDKYSVLNDVGSSITHQDLARHVGTVALAFFAPTLALYALTFNLLSFGNVATRVLKA